MYRVVTKYRNSTSRPVVEHGPWHDSLKTAEHWADVLRQHGYQISIESQRGPMSAGLSDDHNELADALASMA